MNGHLDPLTLSMYADDALSVEERSAAEAHLASCAPCGARLADLRRLDRAVRALPVPPVPAGVLVLHEASASHRRRRLGGLLPWPGRSRQPAAVSLKPGQPVRPLRPSWAAPLASLAVAAGLVLVSLSLVCRGHASLPACAGALRDQRAPVAPWPPPPLATAIVRRAPPGTPAPWLTPAAPAPPAVAGVPPMAVVTPAGGPTEAPYPGPSAERVAAGPNGSGPIEAAAPSAEPVGYPGPGQAGAAPSPRPPFARKTEAAVAAGLATMAADGSVERLFLPATSSGR